MNAKHERGAALLALLAVIMLGASWLLVSRLNAESGMAQAAYRARNAAVLNRAKQALIGYVAAQASKSGENRPGAFPCPEAAADFDDAANEGTISYPCTLPKVGRFPWKSLGLDKLVDASGEPLWYVVSAGWAGANTVINSDSVGQLTVDGVANDSVALIIAPGPAFTVAASSGCAAQVQARPTSGTPDWRNYLECENATYPTPDAAFVTTGPSASFNDQAIRITVADIVPALEAAIANRIEREILPALKTVYTPAAWGLSGSNPVLPFAATFSPGPGAGTSSYQGASASYAGLLPFNQTQGCTESASDLRCTTVTTGTSATTSLPAFLVFSKVGNDVQTAGGGSIRTQSTCSWNSAVYECTGQYNDTTISFTSTFKVTNVAMGLRKLDYSKISVTAMNDVAGGAGTQTVPFTATTVLNADGSATLTIASSALPVVSAPLIGWGTWALYKISIDRATFGDHDLLSTTDGTTGWFARNEWYRLLYYAVAPSNTATRLAAVTPAERSCILVGDCLPLTANSTVSSKSALLVLAGRVINGRSRPSSTLADYFEFGNAKGTFERLTISAASPTMYLDTGTANAYAIPITTLATNSTLQFRALNSNTGTSTLSTTATGTRGLVNADGSNLSASTILANAATQVTWDGTNFVLSKRPFNDRVVASASN